jgi:hypothetical protein
MTGHRLLAMIAAAAAASIASVGLSQAPSSRPLNTVVDSSGRVGIGGCPGGNGIHISTTSGTGSDSSTGINTVINRSVDTTLVFDISQKTWTRTNLAAALSLGLADESRGRYSICAGVTALMPSATLTIRGARGRVHFVASLKNLMDALRLGPGPTSPQPRRL